jgi:hypothetical protein
MKGTPVTSLLDKLKNDISSALKGIIFEYNNESTRNTIMRNMMKYCERSKLRGFRLDQSPETSPVIEDNQLVVDIWIQPNLPLREIFGIHAATTGMSVAATTGMSVEDLIYEPIYDLDPASP